MKGICKLIFLVIALCLFVNVALATILIPDDTTVISEQSFYGDESIKEVNLPEGLLRIEKQAFAYTSLSSVVLPLSLEYFAPDAFEGCPEGLILRVYPDSDALRLCLEYQIPHEIIGTESAPVGISMPTKDLRRWVMDGENIEIELRNSGIEAELQYAANDVATQINQVETMINNGCKVIVIAPINGHLLNTVLAKAKEKGVKVIAYDRLLMDSDAVDYYVTFDNYMVGTVQGTYVKEELDLDNAVGPFYMEITAGDPGDNNARSFYQGAIDVLKPYIDAGKIIVRSGQTLFTQVATPTWKTDVAQKRAEDILAGYYANGEPLDAWLCSNDSIALGVTNALDNYTGEGWPIITGQDCDIPNVKNMIAGKQAMSVFKDSRTEAAQTAKMVKQILAGEEAEINDTETYNNNVITVPSFLCAPVFADLNNYYELLIDSGYYTEDQLGGGSSRPRLTQTTISPTGNIEAGRNCTFTFEPIEDASYYSVEFCTNGTTIMSWDRQSAQPDTNLTIPGYWLTSGNHEIIVTASASGYNSSTTTLSFNLETGSSRSAPAVEVNQRNVTLQEEFIFSIDTENANDLIYRIDNDSYIYRINVFEEETVFATSRYNTGNYTYRFAVRRGNTWSEWSKPIIICVSEETAFIAPKINVLSTLEEGRDLIISLSETPGATEYIVYIYSNNGSYHYYSSLQPSEIASIEIPGYNISAGSYELSAYSSNGKQHSNTTYKSITIRDADKPDAPDIEPPESLTVSPYNYITFAINTSNADCIAVRYYRTGYTNDVYYDTKALTNSENNTSWTFRAKGDFTWKYSFSVRKNGIWSFWSSPIAITIDESGGNSDNLIKVGIIHLDPAESGYREANVLNMVNTFTTENGYEASFVTAPTSDRQLDAARGFIADGVKYILISAMDPVGWGEVLQEAKDAGIGVFLFDRMVDVDPSLYTAAVVSDMSKEGETAVAWLESLNLEEYKILHIKGQLGSTAQIGRTGALEAKCIADDNWAVVREGTGGDYWDPEEARKITQAAINAGEDFNIIYAENDSMANGAVEALDNAGITHGVNGDVIIMGFDCNKWALRKLLAGEWNYDGQCSPFQAAPIDRMIKKLEAGEAIEGLNELNQYINDETGFDARTITEADVNKYGLGY